MTVYPAPLAPKVEKETDVNLAVEMVIGCSGSRSVGQRQGTQICDEKRELTEQCLRTCTLGAPPRRVQRIWPLLGACGLEQCAASVNLHL